MEGVRVYDFLFCNPVLFNCVCVGYMYAYVTIWHVDISLSVGLCFFT